jgi:hypothetical protein
MKELGAVPKTVLLILLFGWVVGLQLAYDITRPPVNLALPQNLSPGMIRAIDLGFNAAAGSFFWIPTMPEVLDLLHSRAEYFTDLAFVNAVDPKLSYPYAFSVLTLPIVPERLFPDAVSRSFEIGTRGIANADPDWRIAYYMAINYYLILKDLPNAARYFDIAAKTPGAPDYAVRFSLNFGIAQRDRDRVRNLWVTVYQSTNDPDTKARAAAYVERMNEFDYLDAALRAYQQRFGARAATLQDLVTKGVISAIPQDPFGFTFMINVDGTTGLDFTKLPSYIISTPAT